MKELGMESTTPGQVRTGSQECGSGSPVSPFEDELGEVQRGAQEPTVLNWGLKGKCIW